MKVTIYTKPGCKPCEGTKKMLTKKGIEFEAVDVTEVPSATKVVTDLGYAGVPVVVVDCGDEASWTWHGFAPSQIEKLAALQ
ncbi:glutaredoxin [Mycobacterium phage YassJohnny]|nr:glutaredoxin [Mycobacterium phage YassJohnny]